MAKLENILEEINIFRQCRKYNFKLLECPTFLFAIIGIVTIVSMIGIYFAANQDESPEKVVVLVSLIAMIIFGVGNVIVKSVERIASANQAKTEFVNIASHQLKAPLAGIRWTTNLLLNSKTAGLSEETANYIKTIEEENFRMIRLVNDLLNVARIERGKIVMMPQRLELAKIVEKTVKDLSTLAGANNIKIVLNKEKDVPCIFADPSYLQIAVDNLVSNAIKYTKGGGFIKIDIKKFGKCAEFRIEDNGVGIPEHQKVKIFEKFFRSDNIMRQQTDGTGLGLFIAKAIVDSNKGKIGFSSKEGKGSVFWFTIPEDKRKAVPMQ